MSETQGFMKRLGRAFLLQGLLISIVAVLSLSVTTIVIKDILVRKALELEAEHFWKNYNNDKAFPLSNTYNLLGYLQGRSLNIPLEIAQLSPGVHEYKDGDLVKIIYVSIVDNKKLYLVYNNAQVNKLVMLYALVPLGFVLVLIYLSGWLAYRISDRAFSPITWLAERVNDLNPAEPDGNIFVMDDFRSDANYANGDYAKGNYEVSILTKAMHGFTKRLNRFVERERNLTRDASHELRTPLTVINASADVLLLEGELSMEAKTSVDRIKRCCNDMQEIIDAFLMLARESEAGDIDECTDIVALAKEEVGQAEFLIMDKPVVIEISYDCELIVQAPKKVVSVLLGNLLRNAIKYTKQGFVKVHITQNAISIEDSGPGIVQQELEQVFRPFFRGKAQAQNGYGVGLAIVKRILQQFSWQINIESTVGVGTRITVNFA